MPGAGILRQLLGKITESKSTGKAFTEELNKEFSQENISKAKDGDCPYGK